MVWNKWRSVSNCDVLLLGKKKNVIAHFVYVHVCVSGGTQNTIIMAFVWSLTRLSTACRRTRSTWQWDNNLSIRNRGEMNIPSHSFSLACNLYVPDFFAIRITQILCLCARPTQLFRSWLIQVQNDQNFLPLEMHRTPSDWTLALQPDGKRSSLYCLVISSVIPSSEFNF